MSAGTILVVASPAEAQRLSLWLTEAKLGEVVTTDGGPDTLTALAERHLSVVVLCAGLPGVDTLALAHAVRATAAGSTTCLVLVAGQTGPVRTALDAIDHGADRFLRRPLAKKVLLYAVRSCLELGRADVVDMVAELPHPDPPEIQAAVSGGATAIGLGDALRAAVLAPAAPAPAPAAAAAVTSGVAVHALKSRLDEATSEAIDAFLHDALESELALPLADEDADEYQEIVVSGEATPAYAGGIPSGVAAGETVETAYDEVLLAETAAPGAVPDAVAAADVDAVVEETPAAPAAPDGGVATEAGFAPSSGFASPDDDTPPPWREPTQILELGPRRAEPAPDERAAVPEEHAGTYVSELRRHMSDAEARLFGSDESSEHDDYAESPPPDIDLDAIGMSTLPGVPMDDQAPAIPPEDLSGQTSALEDNEADDAELAAVTDPGRARRGAGAGAASAAETPAARAALAQAQTSLARSGQAAGTGDVAAAEGTPAPTTGSGRTTAPTARGDIREDDVALLLARLSREAFSGRITFRRGDAEKAIFLEGGRPVFATSNLPHDRMGDLLFREGKITREQHARSRDIVAETGRRMGEILVDMGFLKRRELLPAVRRHVEDIIYSLFAWDTGTYVTAPGDDARDERIRLATHPTALILEGIRRKMSLDRLRLRLGPLAAVVVPLVRPGEPGSGPGLRPGDLAAALADADLSSEERRVAELFDGRRTLAEVLAAPEAALLDEAAVYQLAYSLAALGLARILERGSSTDAGRGPAGTAVTPPSASITGAADLAIDRERVLAKYAHVREADYFVVLGVRRDASAFEIRRAYEAARRDYAAESFPREVQSELHAELAEILAVLDEAQRVLRNDEVRGDYLQHLKD